MRNRAHFTVTGLVVTQHRWVRTDLDRAYSRAPRVYPRRSVNLWNEPTTFICVSRSRAHPWKPGYVKQQDGHDGITRGIL